VIRETQKTLTCPSLGTIYRALSAEATTAFGLSPAVVVHDELGQFPIITVGYAVLPAFFPNLASWFWPN
jgi:hypothetical protein